MTPIIWLLKISNIPKLHAFKSCFPPPFLQYSCQPTSQGIKQLSIFYQEVSWFSISCAIQTSCIKVKQVLIKFNRLLNIHKYYLLTAILWKFCSLQINLKEMRKAHDQNKQNRKFQYCLSSTQLSEMKTNYYPKTKKSKDHLLKINL